MELNDIFHILRNGSLLLHFMCDVSNLENKWVEGRARYSHPEAT